MIETPIHLRFDDVSKHYGNVRAVDGVSIDIHREEFLTLLGASGSGKTTMLMTIAGFTVPDRGQIILDGEDITYTPPFKRNIGVVFQNYALFPHMTVFENVAYPLRVRRTPRSAVEERVEGALELVRLGGFGQRYPHQLSGGQQQRIALARSLVFEPKLLLMDEPLGALDKKLREHMQLEIKHLQRNLKVTVIYVTHDQSEALTMSDRIAIMNDGRFEQVGSPEELYRAPANRFVADFIGETCFLKATAAPADGDRGVARVGEAFVRFPLLQPVAAGEALELMVRPEAVVLAGGSEDEQNTIAGVVEEAVYLGEFTTYHVRLSDGQILFMKRQNFHGIQDFRTGDEIEVAWNVHDTRQV